MFFRNSCWWEKRGRSIGCSAKQPVCADVSSLQPSGLILTAAIFPSIINWLTFPLNGHCFTQWVASTQSKFALSVLSLLLRSCWYTLNWCHRFWWDRLLFFLAFFSVPVVTCAPFGVPFCSVDVLTLDISGLQYSASCFSSTIVAGTCHFVYAGNMQSICPSSQRWIANLLLYRRCAESLFLLTLHALL